MFLSQYVYIFVYKNFAPLDEAFFARFLYINIALISTIFGLVFFTIPGQMNLNYYICTGEDPNIDPYAFKKVQGADKVPGQAASQITSQYLPIWVNLMARK